MLRGITLIFAAVALVTASSYGQVRISMSQREKNKLKQQAEEKVREFVDNKLNALLNTDASESDRRETIASMFPGTGTEPMLFDQTFLVPDDADAKTETTAETDQVKILSYLGSLYSNYQPGAHFSVKDVRARDEIYVGKDRNYLYVDCSIIPSGKTHDGAALAAKRMRVMELQIVPVNAENLTLINRIELASEFSIPADAVPVKIAKDATNVLENQFAADYTEAYCTAQLSLGDAYLKDRNYAQAYFAYEEARQNEKTKPEAARKKDLVLKEISDAGNAATSYLYDSLMSLGINARRAYNLKLSRKLLNTALQIRPDEKQAVQNELALLTHDERDAADLASAPVLLDAGKWNEAAAILADCQNRARGDQRKEVRFARLGALSLAKCYYMIGNRDVEAEQLVKLYLSKGGVLGNGNALIYANILIRQGKFNEAQSALIGVRENAAIILSKAILIYFTAKSTREADFEHLLDKSIESNLDQSMVDVAPGIAEIYRESDYVKKKFRQNGLRIKDN